jgi:hypothetical protein
MTFPSFSTADATSSVADAVTQVREISPIKGSVRTAALTKRIAELDKRGLIRRQEYQAATTSDLQRQLNIQTRANKGAVGQRESRFL